MAPIRPDLQAGFWYFYYFATERGRAGLTANRRDIAKVIWARNSPNWHVDDAVLERAAAAFDNPDYVDVVLHSYRHRLGLAPSCNFPATDGTASAAHFTGPRAHHQVPNAGHNLPQEAPGAFAGAILELAALRSVSGGA